MDCVFCNIINGVNKVELLFENERLVVVRDIFPKAPVHLLVIPKKHINSVHHLEPGDEQVVGEMVWTAKQMADKEGVGETGYKLVFNVGRDGGMTIPHLHMHLLGGKAMGE
jgi:histidine triad (HIT) family protein